MTEDKQPQEERDLEWFEKPDAPPEHKATVDELMNKVRKLTIAGESLPRRQVIRMVGVGFYMALLCYILYVSIGNAFASYSFIFCATGIIVCLDDLNLARKLRRIQKGEPQ